MKRVNRSVAETMHVPEALIRDCEDHWSNCTGMVTSPKTTVTGLHRDELQLLRQTYKAMYPSQAAVFDERYIFGDMYVKSYTLEYGPNLYASATKGVRTSKNGWIMARWFGANAPNRNPEPTPGFHSLFLETQCGGSGKRCDAEALFCPGDMVQALAHSDVLHPSPHSVEKG